MTNNKVLKAPAEELPLSAALNSSRKALIENHTIVSAEDDTILTFGKYKGSVLAEVPAAYLIWVYENYTGCPYDIKKYIAKNYKLLEKIADEEDEKWRDERGTFGFEDEDIW